MEQGTATDIAAGSEAPAYDAIAAAYDLMMQDRGPYVAFYAGVLAPSDRGLLDLACGTGTITAALAQRMRARHGGVRVTGVDGSAGMLAEARQRDPAIDWRQGDLRALPPMAPVDLAICCYNTLQHLDAAGLGQALRQIHGRLVPGGRLAFDIYRPNLPYLRQDRQDTLARTLTGPDGAALEIREDARFDEARGILHIAWRLVPADRPEAAPLAATAYRLWQHAPATVEAALAAAGFEMLDRWGGLDRSPWHDGALKQVILARAC